MCELKRRSIHPPQASCLGLGLVEAAGKTEESADISRALGVHVESHKLPSDRLRPRLPKTSPCKALGANSQTPGRCASSGKPCCQGASQARGSSPGPLMWAVLPATAAKHLLDIPRFRRSVTCPTKAFHLSVDKIIL